MSAVFMVVMLHKDVAVIVFPKNSLANLTYRGLSFSYILRLEVSFRLKLWSPV